jgi:SAM-dependent methyltransferase/uncharacterized protein YbaR (Trm112 family)
MDKNKSKSVLGRYSPLGDILCCPVTKEPLRLVEIGELLPCLSDAERGRVPEGTIGAFVSDATDRAYPLTERVVDFLDEDSLAIRASPSATAPTTSADGIKRSVKDWYDRFGWTKNELGMYRDSALFSQSEPVGNGLYEMVSHLSIMDRLAGGEFVLDAASGAIPHPEYLAFSWFFRSRVCVDMSVTALMEASAKLRPSDFCCMADICKLPFRDETFDGAVSAYTIHHIPESQQIRAIEELYRVIRPNAHLCILTGVTDSRRHRSLVLMLRAFRKLSKVLRLVRPRPSPADSTRTTRDDPPHALYGQLQEPAWWKGVASGMTDRYRIESLRLLRMGEFEALYGHSNRAAKALRWIEGTFPRLTSGMSAYCVIDICKPARSGE